MTNPYYTNTIDLIDGTKARASQVESNFSSVELGFDAAYVQILLRGSIAGQAWTGAHTFPTQTLGDNSTLAATTSFVAQGLALKANAANPSFTGNATVEGSITVGGGSVIPGFAPLASPAFTDSPTAPTAPIATSTTQLATTQFVKDVFGTVPSGSLPALAGNAGKSLRVDSGETGVQWAYANIGTVVTATTATTLTSTPTLLQITPANYGVTVTLPDATTCPVGGPLHCIDNRGAYPVRVCDSTGTLKGFIFAGVVSYISLDNNATAAGLWAITNNELVGPSAQLLTANMGNVAHCFNLGGGRELLISGGGPTSFHACVYNRNTNVFGAQVLIRASTNGSYSGAVLVSADKVLVVSCDTGEATFEAVCLTIDGDVVTVNPATTTTLSSNLLNFAVGGALIAVGSSYVTAYNFATGTAGEIRALSVSGTTVTIGAASTLDGATQNFAISAAANHVIAVTQQAGTGGYYTKPYLVSGSTLTAGTGTSVITSSVSFSKLFTLGTRWFITRTNSGGDTIAAIISLNATGNGTTTVNEVTAFTAASLSDAIVVGSDKVLVVSSAASSNAVIVTDSAGTPTIGTRASLQQSSTPLYVSGSTVVAYGASGTEMQIQSVDCSGANPTVAITLAKVSTALADALNGASDTVGRRWAPNLSWATGATKALMTSGVVLRLHYSNALGVRTLSGREVNVGASMSRGAVSSEAWVTSGSSVTKMEAALV